MRSASLQVCVVVVVVLLLPARYHIWEQVNIFIVQKC